MAHYHISWSSKKELDWEAFNSAAKAEERARALVQPEETYTIIARDEDCARCRSARELKTAHA
jgi:hypothetical protein